MANALKVRVDLGGAYSTLRAQFEELKTKEVRIAASRALNRVGVSARKAAAPVIAKELENALPVPVIRRAIKFRNARGDRLYIDLRAVGGDRIPARLFSPRQTKAGVTLRIGSRTVRVPGAFVTPSGAVRVRGPDWKGQFFNKTTIRRIRLRRGDVPDYPIPQIYVPGVPRVFLETTVVSTVQAVARDRFPLEFARQLQARARGLIKVRS
jgi:hypothetical protein